MSEGWKSGFTFVEVVMAMVIASLGLGILYAAAIQSLRQVRMAREYARAAIVVEYEVERLGTMPWSDIVAHGSSYAMTASNNPSLALLDGAAGTVQFVSEGGDTNVLRTSFHLNWTGRHPRSQDTNAFDKVIISRCGFLR